jgi:hypothetical protein
MTDEEKLHDSIRLQANEVLLESKGFLLFAVTDDGNIKAIGDGNSLTYVERLGLERYVDTFIYPDDPEFSDENCDDRTL